MIGLPAARRQQVARFAPAGSQSVALTPASGTLQRGGTLVTTVTVTRTGTTGDATLSVSGLPSGVTAVISQNPLVSPTSTATITLSAAADAALVTALSVTVTSVIPGVPNATAAFSLTTAEAGAFFTIDRPMPSTFALNLPERPRQTVSTTMPVVTGVTRNVAAGGDLQAALDAAQYGDEVVLEAGAVFTGNYILRPKTGSGWIIVRTAGTPTAPGVRVTPTAAAGFAKIQTNALTECCFRTQFATAGIRGWRFVNLEMRVASALDTSVTPAAGMFLANPEISPLNIANQPRDIILDRCYIDGNGKRVRIGAQLEVGGCAVIDSDIRGIGAPGFEDKALLFTSGAGPVLIRNNFLEAASINVLFGGIPNNTAATQPCDIQILNNHFYKRPSWIGGGFAIKNWLEKKLAARMQVEDNYFENNWLGAQGEWGLVLSTDNSDVSLAGDDVWVSRNVFTRSAGIFNLSANMGAVEPAFPMSRVCIYDNLVLDQRDRETPTSRQFFVQAIDNLTDLVVAYNSIPDFGLTLTQGGVLKMARNTATAADQAVRLTWHANLSRFGASGVIGSDNVSAFGVNGLNVYAAQWQGAANVLEGADAANYPTGFFRPTTIASGDYVSQATGNYELIDGTPWTFSGAKAGYRHASVTAALAARSSELPP